MGVGKDEAERIARLAAIELTEAERDAMGAHLKRILAFVEKLGEVDTEGVEPLNQPHGEITIFREDEPAESLDVEQALANAPDRQGHFIKVPRILESGG